MFIRLKQIQLPFVNTFVFSKQFSDIKCGDDESKHTFIIIDTMLQPHLLFVMNSFAIRFGECETLHSHKPQTTINRIGSYVSNSVVYIIEYDK